MENFAVDVVAADGTVRHRTWFKMWSEAVAAANTRKLALPVGPSDRVVVLQLTPVFETDGEDDEPKLFTEGEAA